MPITSSAKKALRQNKTHRALNVKRITALKTTIKKFKKLLLSDKTAAQKFLPEVYAKIDKSAKTAIIKKNTASRLKSRLTIQLAKLLKK